MSLGPETQSFILIISFRPWDNEFYTLSPFFSEKGAFFITTNGAMSIEPSSL